MGGGRGLGLPEVRAGGKLAKEPSRLTNAESSGVWEPSLATPYHGGQTKFARVKSLPPQTTGRTPLQLYTEVTIPIEFLRQLTLPAVAPMQTDTCHFD